MASGSASSDEAVSHSSSHKSSSAGSNPKSERSEKAEGAAAQPAETTPAADPAPVDANQGETDMKDVLLQDDQYERENPRADFMWNDVKYTVKQNKKDLQILKGVSGSVRSGELYAIMGPSGCGKTTLLDILANRKHEGAITGEFLINGHPRSRKSFRRLSSYVQQEDVLLGTMTVDETLMFHAKLKLTRGVNKRERVNWVIDQLALGKVRNRKIGNLFIRGISGGEKRRVSIATELLTQPSILFLDEPTTGLSSADALRVMDCLRALASQGKTIICTIHQPRSNIFNALDGVLLMEGGSVCYCGPPTRVVEHFSALGPRIPEHTNPADWMLDLISVDPRFLGDDKKEEELADIGTNEEGVVTPSIVSRYKDEYLESEAGLAISGAITDMKARPGVEVVESADFREYATSPLKQMFVLLGRFNKSNLRNPAALWVRIVSQVFVGLMMGSVYWKLGMSTRYSGDRFALLFFVVAQQSLGAIAVLPDYIDQRAIFQRERGGGAYRSLPYFIANTISELPLQIVIASMLSIVMYFMTGLNTSGDRFAFFCLASAVLAEIGASFVQVVSVISPDATIGNALASMGSIFFMLFSGFLVKTNNIPIIWKWAYYISFWNYGYKMLVINEYVGTMHEVTPSPGQPAPAEPVYITGEQILEQQGISHTDSKWWALAVSGFLYLAFRVLCYLLLKYLTKKK